MNHTQLAPPTAAMVRQAVKSIVPSMSTTHHFDAYKVYYLAAERLGVDVNGYYKNRQAALIADALYAQVKRALDLLASQGALVKIPKNQLHPDGVSQGNVYYRPEAMEAAQERARLARVESDLVEARWGNVFDRLTGAGIVITTRRGQPVELGLNMYERIADLLAGA